MPVLGAGTPRLLPDATDSCTQFNLHAAQALDSWCSVMTDLSTVDWLQRAFDEAKIEAQTYFDPNVQLLTDLPLLQRTAEQELVSLRAQQVTLMDDKTNFGPP